MNVLVLIFISTVKTMLCITGSKCHDQLKLLQLMLVLVPYYVVAVIGSVRQANMYTLMI